MKNVDATIISIDFDESGRWRKQKIYIAYDIEGKNIEKELKSDTIIESPAWLGGRLFCR